jgi:hypothetical protein
VAENRINKKGDLQCRSKSCKKVFHHSDLKIIKTERFGFMIDEKVCPFCGSNTYGLIDYPISEEELIYKTGKFFSNHNRELKIHMDQVTERILEQDKKRQEELHGSVNCY